MAEKEWQKARLGVWRPSCQTTLCSDHISVHSSLFILLCKWALPSFKGLTIWKQLLLLLVVFFFLGGGGGSDQNKYLTVRISSSNVLLILDQTQRMFLFFFLVHPMTWHKQYITATLKTKRQKSQDAMGKLGCLTVSGLLRLLEHGF